MAVVGTVRAANLTPHERVSIVSTIIPLPAGLVRDGVRPTMVAIDALGPGQHASIQYSAPTKWGTPKRLDGSWRLARIHFACRFDAATSGRWSYSSYTERDLRIETAPAPMPQHTPHPAVNLSDIRIRFRAAAYNEYPGTNTSPPYRGVEFRPLSSRYYPYDAPYEQTEEPRVEFHDTEGSSGRIMRAYRVHGRTLPEREGGDPDEEPSFVGTFYYEVPDQSVPGWSRCVRWWFEWINNDITMDADARAPFGSACRLTAPPILEILSVNPASTPITVQTFLEDLWKPVESDITGGRRIPLYDPNEGPRLCNGSGRVIRGAIWFDGGDPLSPIELSTKAAMLHSQGEQVWPEAISLDWIDSGQYGVYGVCPPPQEWGWASRDAVRDQVLNSRTAGFAYREGGLRAYRNSGPWPLDPLHTGSAGAGRGGSQNQFGSAFLLDFAMGGHPDGRGPWVGQSLEAARGYSFREINGEHWDFDDAGRRAAEVPSTYYSPWVYEYSYPKWVSGWDSGAVSGQYDIRAGNKPGSNWRECGGKQRSPGRSGFLVGNPPRGVFSGYPSSHLEYNGPLFTALCFGDRWIVDSLLTDARGLLLNMLPTPQETTFDSFFSVDVGMAVPRADGRVLKSRAGLAWFTGDTTVTAECAKRVSRIWDWEKNGTYPTNRSPKEVGGNLEVDMACIVGDAGYPREQYYAQAGDTEPINARNQSGSIIDNYGDFESWNGFQQTQFLMGIYAVWRLLTETAAGSYVTEITRAQEIIQKISKAIILHGFRDRGTGPLEAYYCVDWNRDNNWSTRGTALTLAEQAVNEEWFQSNGQLRDGLYGSIQPDRFNLPKFKQRKIYNDWNRWSFPGAALARMFNPSDVDVAARVDELFVNRPPFPTVAGLRGTMDRYADSWPQWQAIIDDPVTRWVAGPRTFNEVARATISMNTTATDVVVYNEVANPTISLVTSAEEEFNGTQSQGVVFFEQANPTISLTATAEDTSNVLPPVGVGATYYEEAKPILSMNASAVEGVSFFESANPRISMVSTVSESLGWNEVAAPTISMVTTARETGTVSTGGGGTEPPPEEDQNDPKTLRELLGPTLTRARNVSITRNPDGTLSRTTSARPYNSPPPREVYKRDRRRRR